MGRFKDLTGRTFGFLHVIRRIDNCPKGYIRYKCICIRDGNLCDVRGNNLQHGNTKSCGCWNRDINAEKGRRNIRHGQSRHGNTSPEYSAWNSAKNRTTNPRNRSWPDYGGRGIRMCDRWLNGENRKSGFECFYEDMGPRPSSKHSIHRIDNDGCYGPNNCIWASRQVQENTKRSNHLITINDRTATLAQWALEANISQRALHGRVKAGWPQNRLLLPVGQHARGTRFIKIGDREMTLNEWAHETGLFASTLHRRIKSGWPQDRLLSPSRGGRREK